jgi:thymidylate kinase
MKLIIFEGLDRCGKDSHIEELRKDLKNYTIRHWGYPQGSNDQEKAEYQRFRFLFEFEHYASVRYAFGDHVMIWNRSHIGEMVYGKLYRDSNPESWVMQLEDHFEDTSKIYLILLTADPEFIASQDDGKSYSDRAGDKRSEAELFEAAVNQSIIKNKLILKVNDGEQYRDFGSLHQQIREFVGI